MPDLKTFLLICAVLLWAGVQYGLMAWAMRDLLRRRRVRGGNKTMWGLLILTLPILGALIYAFAASPAHLARPTRLTPQRPRLIAHDDTAA